MIPPTFRQMKNKDDKTPQDLFASKQVDLVSKGEEWMNKYMLVATLIATIVFAAAFTLTGGYDSVKGCNLHHISAVLVSVSCWLKLQAFCFCLSGGKVILSTSSEFCATMPKTLDTQSVLKRLQSELMDLMMNGDSGISAFPEGDNIFCWKGTISRSKDTVFQGTEYKLSLLFPNDYPFKPPMVKFEIGCFHPNVGVFGNICLDILQDKWSSTYDVRIAEPNIALPLNTQAAALWSNQEEYRKMV
ncbi:hypothetical protein L1987_09325 [Smallanthus sonchifolius]|uniref:Uncharacterized protein n=1 Tax=Smallanthus sonchifolius TaxID=185202 RepID=A0ACB9JMM1_9ASTR|nr:hypothetical protein L1987_09325 [Smallanthus sonchifolius]